VGLVLYLWSAVHLDNLPLCRTVNGSTVVVMTVERISTWSMAIDHTMCSWTEK
jgi:hypothetical protein